MRPGPANYPGKGTNERLNKLPFPGGDIRHAQLNVTPQETTPPTPHGGRGFFVGCLHKKRAYRLEVFFSPVFPCVFGFRSGNQRRGATRAPRDSAVQPAPLALQEPRYGRDKVVHEVFAGTRKVDPWARGDLRRRHQAGAGSKAGQLPGGWAVFLASFGNPRVFHN